jgi:WD40 repeat protein
LDGNPSHTPQVLVFDLKSGAKPFRPAPKSNRIEDVSTLSWNQMADYILAVGSNNGSTAVYDLRGKREIMKLSYPGGRKQVTGLAWHPNLVCTRRVCRLIIVTHHSLPTAYTDCHCE